MPQLFNDESIIPALVARGIRQADAADYAVVGCVELSAQGNCLGWSDAAMFNMVKVLELSLNDGRCMLTGRQLGPKTGALADLPTYEALEAAFERQMDHFVEKMVLACDAVDRLHAEVLPSPFLSSVVDDCLERGVDVTAGGAVYNLSGLQGIQVANVADSLAALKKCVFDERSVEAGRLLEALRDNFRDAPALRALLINRVEKYGNDVAWVDALGRKWAAAFARKLAAYTNARGGPYHAGFYTVSAHLPMGRNVGATPDGRLARSPLADGGLSAMAGRDRRGPTALLRSVGRIDSRHASNGTLLNMKFLPGVFRRKADRSRFCAMLRGFVELGIHHVQFNVVSRDDLLAAQRTPEAYRGLTVRVAGYTAYFTDLAADIQNEIIARTAFGA
jgi:formate C-acetyltransferase